MVNINERTGIIIHRGKKIGFADFSNLSAEESIVFMRQLAELKIQNPDVDLMLSDFTNCRYNKDSIEESKKVMNGVRGHVKKQAVLGMHRVKKMLLSMILKAIYGVEVKAFDTKEEALDWLTEE